MAARACRTRGTPTRAPVLVVLALVVALPPPAAGEPACAALGVPPVDGPRVCVEADSQSARVCVGREEVCVAAARSLADPLAYHARLPPPERYDCTEHVTAPNCCAGESGCASEKRLDCVDVLHGPYAVVEGAASVPDAYAGLWYDRVCYYVACPEPAGACSVHDRLHIRAPWYELVLGE